MPKPAGDEDDEIKQLFRSDKKEKNNEKSDTEIALLVQLGIHKSNLYLLP
ncbi:hypothetical protein Scep_003043 [Stephania cephalantha]|uniref:Uncharacterized protein n=1 Tax=Stephania cephalantha TaxID=152367 RepID=A0AAP0LCQ5_9MAGN